MSEKAVAVVNASDARARALALIDANQDAISFVRQEDLDTQGLFVPVVSVLNLDRSDFHDLGAGAMMPKSHHVSRMAEYAGVFIHAVQVRQVGEFAWIGNATGEKRMPDGTMRPGAQEYLYDAEKRAELDVLKDTKDKYSTEKAQRIHLLETAKFGVQRAGTGARLALIRYFCKTPTSFKQNELQKAMLFSRVDVNTDALLADPEMRGAAIDHALGAERALFGPRDVTPKPAQIEAPPEADGADEFDDGPVTSEEPVLGEEKQQKWQAIQEYVETYNLPEKGLARVTALTAVLSTAPLEDFDDLLGRLKKFAENHPEAQR